MSHPVVERSAKERRVNYGLDDDIEVVNRTPKQTLRNAEIDRMRNQIGAYQRQYAQFIVGHKLCRELAAHGHNPLACGFLGNTAFIRSLRKTGGDVHLREHSSPSEVVWKSQQEILVLTQRFAEANREPLRIEGTKVFPLIHDKEVQRHFLQREAALKEYKSKHNLSLMAWSADQNAFCFGIPNSLRETTRGLEVKSYDWARPGTLVTYLVPHGFDSIMDKVWNCADGGAVESARQSTHVRTIPVETIRARLERLKADDDHFELKRFLERLPRQPRGNKTWTVKDFESKDTKHRIFLENPLDKETMQAMSSRRYKAAYEHWLAAGGPDIDHVRSHHRIAPLSKAALVKKTNEESSNKQNKRFAALEKREARACMSLLPMLFARFVILPVLLAAVIEEYAKLIMAEYFPRAWPLWLVYSAIESKRKEETLCAMLCRAATHMVYLVDPWVGLFAHILWNTVFDNPMTVIPEIVTAIVQATSGTVRRTAPHGDDDTELLMVREDAFEQGDAPARPSTPGFAGTSALDEDDHRRPSAEALVEPFHITVNHALLEHGEKKNKEATARAAAQRASRPSAVRPGKRAGSQPVKPSTHTVSIKTAKRASSYAQKKRDAIETRKVEHFKLTERNRCNALVGQTTAAAIAQADPQAAQIAEDVKAEQADEAKCKAEDEVKQEVETTAEAAVPVAPLTMMDKLKAHWKTLTPENFPAEEVAISYGANALVGPEHIFEMGHIRGRKCKVDRLNEAHRPELVLLDEILGTKTSCWEKPWLHPRFSMVEDTLYLYNDVLSNKTRAAQSNFLTSAIFVGIKVEAPITWWDRIKYGLPWCWDCDEEVCELQKTCNSVYHVNLTEMCDMGTTTLGTTFVEWMSKTDQRADTSRSNANRVSTRHGHSVRLYALWKYLVTGEFRGTSGLMCMATKLLRVALLLMVAILVFGCLFLAIYTALRSLSRK